MAENNAGNFQEDILTDNRGNEFGVIPVPANGWCLYLSLLTALEISTQDSPAPPRTTTQEAVSFAEKIKNVLNSAEGATAKRLIQILLQNLVSNDMSDEDRSNIDNEIEKIAKNPQYDSALKDGIIKSLIFQYEKDGATLEKDTDGNKINSAEDYIRKISTAKNPANLEEGPQAWPDMGVIGDIASKLLKSTIFVFQKDPDNKLEKIAEFKNEEGIHVLYILYVNRNKFDVLVLLPEDIQGQEEAPSTDANANPLGKEQKKASFGSKFYSALQSAKKKLSLASMKKGIKDLGKKAYKAGRVLATGRFHGEIIISGERVRVDEEGFIPGDESEITSFKTKYFPNLMQNEEQLELVKSVFKMIFSIDKTDDQIKLPCDDQEQEILLDGLRTRRETLWNELKNLYDRRSTPALLRTKLQIYERLNILIMNLERDMDVGICQDYSPDGTPAGFRRVNLEDENNMRELLRNFVFLILQAKMPVQEFSEVTDTARELVTTIHENEISQTEMTEYLDLWREQAALKNEKIPNIIGEILEGVDAQPGLVHILAEDQLNSLYKEIVEQAKLNYQASIPDLLSEFNTFLKNGILDTDTFKDKIKKLISWIQTRNTDCLQKLNSLQREQLENKQGVEKKMGDLQKIQQELATTQQKLLKKTVELQLLQKTSISKDKELELSKGLVSRLNTERDNLEQQKVALFNAAQNEQKCKQELKEKMERGITLSQEVEEAGNRAAATQGASDGVTAVARQYRTTPPPPPRRSTPSPARRNRSPPPRLSLPPPNETMSGGGTSDQEIAILRTTINNLKEELSRIQQTQGSCLEQAKADVQSLQTQLAKYETTNGELNKQLAEKQAELNVIQKSSNLDTSKLNEEITTTVATIESLKKMSEETQQKYNEQEKEHKAQIFQLSESFNNLNTQKDLAELELTRIQEELAKEIKINEKNEENLKKQETIYVSNITKLTSDIESLSSAKNAAEKRAQSLNYDKEGYEEENERLLNENDSIKRENREILSQIVTMTQAIENGTRYTIPSTLARTITEPFNDLYQRINSVKSKTSLPTLCLLSYIIKTILRQITYTNPLAQQSFLEILEVSKKIMLTPSKETLLPMINMLFTIIQFAYKYTNFATNKMQKITVIKTNSQYTALFQQIYNNFKNLGNNPKIFDITRTIYLTQILFSMSDDTKQVAEIYFHLPINNSQAPIELQDDINFIIKRSDYPPNEFDKQTFIVLGADSMNTAVEKSIDRNNVSTFIPIYDQIYADKTVSITSLTALFIIYSMEYLKLAKDEINKENCVLDFSSTRYSTKFE